MSYSGGGPSRDRQATVGIDIGTTSVKAVAVNAEGEILARARVPHRLVVPAPDLFEHDANQAWRRGPLRALAALGGTGAVAVGVTSMVPSMTAVDRRGRALTPGLIYGDARGRSATAGPPGPEGGGEVLEFLRWTAAAAPEGAGYWPAQAVANRALGGDAAVDLGVAFTAAPLYGPTGWDPDVCEACGVDAARLPRVDMPGAAAGRLEGKGAILAAPSVDVWCEQLVAGAEEEGDVHVVCGTTLIVWAVAAGAQHEIPGLWTVGHRSPENFLVGGASNAGGLFLDWVGRLAGRERPSERLDPSNIPVWAPYPRGERTPYHDPERRAQLHDLDLTHGPAAVRRAAFEASGFVVRHHLELAGVRGRRVVATGGGTRVEPWMTALADATGLPVHVASAPEGAARGAAFLARIASGLETDLSEAARWASTGHVVEPDVRWADAASDRFGRFLELSGPTLHGNG